MSRSTYTLLAQDLHNEVITAAAATKSGVGGADLSVWGCRSLGDSASAADLSMNQFFMSTTTSTKPSNPPDNTVKGGVADEESFFKRSLQTTLTVNALQVQAVRR